MGFSERNIGDILDPSYLRKISDCNYDDVRKFCIKDLAEIFYKCLKHDEPRAETDWLTAEKVIATHAPLIHFTKKFLVLSVHEELKSDSNFKYEDPKKVSEDYSGDKFTQELGRIKSSLDSFLVGDKFAYIVDHLDLKKRREYQKKFLGRDIWDYCYQPFRKKIDTLEYLGFSRYNGVIFR